METAKTCFFEIFRALFLTLLPIFVIGQNEKVDDAPINLPPRGCEFNTSDLRGVSEQGAAGSLLILIARPGERDHNPQISRRRLYTARAYLTDYTNARLPETIVIAESFPTRRKPGFGGVEIYVDGKLVDFLTSKPDQDLAIGYCSSEEPSKQELNRLKFLYPWKFRIKWMLKAN